MIPAITLLLTLAVSSPVWADHGGGLRGPTMSPVLTALLWAGAVLLVGMAVVAIVTVLSRRRSAGPHDG